MKTSRIRHFRSCLLLLLFLGQSGNSADVPAKRDAAPRTKVLINDDWRFNKGDPPNFQTNLTYGEVKPWLLPAGNSFIADPANRAKRPDGNPGGEVPYASVAFDDSSWRRVDLPHDYAIEGPFTNAVSGSTGRLPSSGVVWYRKKLNLPSSDDGKSIFLDIDGAMSYSMVWLNGRFVGGWPYGYASYRLNLTPHVIFGQSNVLAIRLDNPVPKDANWQSASSPTGTGEYGLRNP